MLSSGPPHFAHARENGSIDARSAMFPHRPPTSGLDALAEGSQYAMQQMQQQQQQPAQPQDYQPAPRVIHRKSHSTASIGSHGVHDEGGTPNNAKARRNTSAGNQPVRRRISRACDQCNQLRTKCDGSQPCAHCLEFGLSCEYERERKKRGKASRKEIAAQQAAAAAGGGEAKPATPRSANGNSSDDTMHGLHVDTPRGVKRRRSGPEAQQAVIAEQRAGSMGGQQYRAMEQNIIGGAIPLNSYERERMQSQPTMMEHTNHQMSLPAPRVPNATMHDRGMPMAMNDYGSLDDYHRSVLHPGAVGGAANPLHQTHPAMPSAVMQGGPIPGYNDNPYTAPSPNSQQGANGHIFRFGESPMSMGFLGQSPMAGSPGWLNLPSPSAALYQQNQHHHSGQSLRYPVLRPLIPHITSILPIGIASDLLDLYFASTSQAFLQPQSPYVHGYVFRKRSFLRPNNPRQCSPALLASMLWLAAQTSESAFLTSPPTARGKICQKLLELTVGLLKPLIHTPSDGTQFYGANAVVNGVALGGFNVALPGHAQEMDGGSPGAAGALDDVVTYIHLATVVSASEYKAASLRWWNAAWSLARELKLGRELPPNSDLPSSNTDADVQGETATGPAHGENQPGYVSEEEREERRRIWWLLYIVDRHLALCYNRPLSLLDVECHSLLQPEDEALWQAGETYAAEAATPYRRRGPGFECTGHNLFGQFLPLMTILGEIVDLNQARNHPRFGFRFHNSADWEVQANEVSQQLEAYGYSLKEFEARHAEPQQQQHATSPENEAATPHSTSSAHQRHISETTLHTKIVLAYGTHLMHTLHILLNGKWDPIALLDDTDLWISSPSFAAATAHAVAAAQAIDVILEYDPDLSYMPFFFGIYLLQGSFLLLLIADKLGAEASVSVVRACESIVRAHEACVTTLGTEYQRNFRKVMRSALAQVRGRLREDFGESQAKRREVLALYRWTGDGTGLAL